MFRNSKRYPNLLRYTVERVLEGQLDHLKERTLGIEVFHRAPDYDTNMDPVVRTTAVEVRKRIAQYYQEPEHERELRISLPAGSYIPEFRLAPVRIVGDPDPAPPVRDVAPTRAFPWDALGYALAGIAAIVIALIYFWPVGGSSPSALDKFWAPVVNSPAPVLLLIGRATHGSLDAPPAPRPVTLTELMTEEGVAFADATTMARLTGLMISRGKAYHIRRFAAAKFEDLRDGPAILIGAFNNDWTLKLNHDVRFRFERVAPLTWISDQQNPGFKDWLVDNSQPYAQVPRDYAIISRVQDPTTGRLLVTAAGLTKFGTAAAGEFLSDPQYIQGVVKRAPVDWDRKNMQIVIATKLVGESSGPPEIIATHFW